MSPHPRPSLALLAVAAVVASASACGRDDGAGGSGPAGAPTVTIVSRDWNGWDPEHRPTPETTLLPAVRGSEVVVEGLGEPVRFAVVEAGPGRVRVATDQRLAPAGETGGSDLGALTDEVTVVPGRETTLDSPTLDAGVSYTLTLGPAGSPG